MIEKLKNLTRRYSKFQRMSFPFIYLMIAIPVIHFLIFWLAVNTNSIALSFQDSQGTFTLNNLKKVFIGFSGQGSGYDLGAALGRSFFLWCINYGFIFWIGVITTYVLYRRIRGHYVYRVCYMIPSLMGSILWTSLVQFMMQYDGIVVELLLKFGVDLPENARRMGLFGASETAFPTLVAIQIVMNMVGNNAVQTGAFSRVPDELYESAELDGAGFWTVCFKIAIPCIWSTLTTLLIFGLCGIFTADANVFLYSSGTGEPDMSTIGFILYKMTYDISIAGGGVAGYNYPAAVGFVLSITTLPIVLFGRWGLEKIQEAVEV